jgi:acyl carrier protein
MTTTEKVNKILLDNLDIKEADLRPDAMLLSDLGATSVDVVEILAALENEFDIEISEEEAQKLRTPGDIVKYIDSRKAP